MTSPKADPGGRVTPRFWHRLIRFRHFIDGSLALASLNLACRNPVPAFPQRSPPLLLTTAACGGLRSTPDCRPRRGLLHLSYSCASPFGPAILVTHDPERSFYHPCCFATRLGGVPGGKETQGWRDSSHTAMVGAGKFWSAKLPMATATYPGNPSFSQYTVEPHVGQK